MVQDAELRLATGLRPRVEHLGLERTPVIVIDDLLTDLAPVLGAAQSATFDASRDSYYPGLRAPLPEVYARLLVTQLLPLLAKVYGIPGHYRPRPRGMSYSLITKPAEALAPLQRLPHFDTPEPYYFAILHYLGEGAHGGTALYRHRATGYERIDAQRSEPYFAKAQQALEQLMQAPPRYFTDSDAHYRRFATIPYRQNRLVIYPGNLLHSVLVNPETDISADPVHGRLTANIFVSFSP